MSPSRKLRKSSFQDGDFYQDDFQNVLSGLFRERDQVFVPLSQILLYPNLTVSDMFRITHRPPPLTKDVQDQPVDRFKRLPLQLLKLSPGKFVWFLLILLSTLTAMVYLVSTWDINFFLLAIMSGIESFVGAIRHAPVKIMETCIDQPLKELYRYVNDHRFSTDYSMSLANAFFYFSSYGPSILGWEGAPLSQICLQITHMGDDGFWRRNMDECLRIYQAKEKAALQIRKPLAYLLTLYILYMALRTFVQAWALRYQRRDVDPNMVETYQAFNMLIRQIKRGMKPTSRNERHEE
jgi:hypothetical protein